MKLTNDVKYLKQMVATLLRDNKALVKQNKALAKQAAKLDKRLVRIFEIASAAPAKK